MYESGDYRQSSYSRNVGLKVTKPRSRDEDKNFRERRRTINRRVKRN